MTKETTICSEKECDRKVLAKGLCGKHYQRERAKINRVNECACGCGGYTENKFLWGHHTRLFSNAEQSRRARMNDGSKQRANFEGKSTYYRKVRGRHEHRIVAEKMIGRPLKKGEVIHHIDHNKRNNDPSNLQVMTQAEHAKLHMMERLNAKSK